MVLKMLQQRTNMSCLLKLQLSMRRLQTKLRLVSLELNFSAQFVQIDKNGPILYHLGENKTQKIVNFCIEIH